MPGDKIAIHPNNVDKITFTENGHTYIDNKNREYISVTTLIGKAFPIFDSKNIAKRKADKLGIPIEQVLNEWEEKGNVGRNNGTRVHEYCENYILNKTLLYNPLDINEKIRFDSAINMIDKLINLFNPITTETEKLVFSPSFGLAGSIDWLFKLKEDQYIIFDWKILNKDLSKSGFNGQTGNILPTLNIQDSNYWHYALQLQIYEYILKSENYIPSNSRVCRYLIVWNGQKFALEKMPEMLEAWALIAWKNKLG